MFTGKFIALNVDIRKGLKINDLNKLQPLRARKGRAN